MRWRIKYSQEADNYFLDNGLLVEDLLYAIIAVAENDGYPTGPYRLGPRIEVWFEAANHTILYERWQSRQEIRVVVIKPKPEAQ